MNLCLICLRTDKMLKLTNDVLGQFYREICGVSDIMASSIHYCIECEHLLTKFYKFRLKCVKAQEIYNEWVATNTLKPQPISLLYTMLPDSPFSEFVPSQDKINFTMEETEPHMDLSIKNEVTKCTAEVKLEDGSRNSDDNLKDDNSVESEPNEENNDGLYDSEEENLKNKHKTKIASKKSLQTKCNRLAINEDKRSSRKLTTISKEKGSKKLSVINKEKGSSRTMSAIRKESSHKLSDSKKEKSVLKLKKPEKKKANCDKIKENDRLYDSIFDIEYLTTDEMQLEEFERRKTYECFVKAQYKCDMCYQTFKSFKFLEYHTDKWHNESPGTVFCPICKIWSPKTSNHRLTHTVVFKCKECPLVTYHRNSMHNHFEQHKGKQYNCEQCNITCKSKSAYRSHMGKVHRRGRHVCEGCGRGFRSPLGLTIHRKNSSRCTASKETANKADGVRCDECDVTLPSQEVFEAHIADVHEPRRNVNGPLAITSAGLPDHRIVTYPRKPRKVTCVQRTPVNVKHTCRVCKGSDASARFSWFQLQLHFKRLHPTEDVDVTYSDMRKHLCHVCGTGFTTVYALRDHMNKHTGALPYVCDLCPKRFRTGYLMRAHRVRHFPSTVPCEFCGMQFKTRGNLYSHKKVHTGEKNFKCDICDKAFSNRANLNEHIRGVHYNVRRVKRGARGGEGKPRGEGEFPDTLAHM